ncbi:hypothetical protein [Gordonia sp. NPDC003429]
MSEQRWIYEPENLRESVIDWTEAFPGHEDLSLEDKVALVRASTPPPHSLRVYMAGDDLITDFPHAVFDGVLMVHLWLHLVGATEENEAIHIDGMPSWTHTPYTRPAVIRTTAKYLMGDLRRLAALLSDTKRMRSGSRAQPTSEFAGSGSLVSRTTYLTGATRAELRAWCGSRPARISSAVALMAAITRALLHVGLDLAPVVHVVVDGRRYDERTAAHLGNFAVGLNLPFEAPHSPEQLAAELGRANFSGRPLAAMTAISWGQAVSQLKRAVGIANAPSSPRPAKAIVSFSHLVGLGIMPEGRWIGGFENHRITISSEPVGLGGIAVLTPQMGDGYDITATFDPACHKPEVVQAALDMVAAGPVALLESLDGQPTYSPR